MLRSELHPIWPPSAAGRTKNICCWQDKEYCLLEKKMRVTVHVRNTTLPHILFRPILCSKATLVISVTLVAFCQTSTTGPTFQHQKAGTIARLQHFHCGALLTNIMCTKNSLNTCLTVLFSCFIKDNWSNGQRPLEMDEWLTHYGMSARIVAGVSDVASYSS